MLKCNVFTKYKRKKEGSHELTENKQLVVCKFGRGGPAAGIRLELETEWQENAIYRNK